ncbi:MAG: GGDEF domain-containing protein [Rhodobacteraceae bacterium]|nr:GGDEF domain-containing protein [Paracoccaceae bacterium]
MGTASHPRSPGVALPFSALDRLMPMHLVISANGTLRHVGPTVQKLLGDGAVSGVPFFSLFDVRNPHGVDTMAQLRAVAQRPLRLEIRNGPAAIMTGLVVEAGEDGDLVLNLSFGIATVDALRETNLTSGNFAATDLTVEMLYLSEAQAVAMAEWRKLSKRLNHAKSRAERAANSDPLTGLSNRRALEAEIAQLLQQSEAFSVMLIDLDHFKQVNDTLGHVAGDDVLRAVGGILRDGTRHDDMVARLGGDEFVVLFAGLTDRGQLSDIVDRILARLDQPIRLGDHSIRVSASMGIAISSHFADPDLQVLMQEADRALYTSKHAGRARFTIAAGCDG